MRRTAVARLSLLQYNPEALAVPATNVFGHKGPSTLDLRCLSSGRAAAISHNERSKELVPRRWLRDGNESCVQHVLRSNELTSDYVVSYRWDDPQWEPFLALPCGDPTGLELRARHISSSLRHLVQDALPMYVVDQTQHTVLHPRGSAQRSFVRCALGGQNRLFCDVTHEGYLDAAKPDKGRGVVALSQSWSLAKEVDRRSMWQRSRQVGALEATLGTYEWQLMHPKAVGHESHEEVFLLEKEYKRHGTGGADAVGLVSSHMVARHPHHYILQFEAPIQCGLDAVCQLYARSCLDNQLRLPEERLHCVASTCFSAEPFLPIDVDLPFQVQHGRPEVFQPEDPVPDRSHVGGPFVTGVPMHRIQWNVQQGVPDYIYEPRPNSNGNKWWRQPMRFPFQGHMWFVRDEHVEQLSIPQSLHLPNPFAKGPTTAGGLPARAQQRQERAKQRLRELKRRTTRTPTWDSEAPEAPGELKK